MKTKSKVLRVTLLIVLVLAAMNFALLHRSSESTNSPTTVAKPSIVGLFDTTAPKSWTMGSINVWRQADGGNGHAYQTVQATRGVSWDSAQAWAVAHGGYLATIQTEAENNFIFHLIDNPKFWVNCTAAKTTIAGGAVAAAPAYRGPWLGGLKSPTTTGPTQGWQWANDGSALTYVHWADQQPNNIDFRENRLVYFSWDRGKPASTWNDVPKITQYPVSFVVEYDHAPKS